jgi:hypothetical protein
VPSAFQSPAVPNASPVQVRGKDPDVCVADPASPVMVTVDPANASWVCDLRVSVSVLLKLAKGLLCPMALRLQAVTSHGADPVTDL